MLNKCPLLNFFLSEESIPFLTRADKTECLISARILRRCNPPAVVAKIKKGLWRVIAKQDSMQKHNWVTAEDA